MGPHHRGGAGMGVSYYVYAVETMGGACWYSVTLYPWKRGRYRMRVRRYVRYREPS